MEFGRLEIDELEAVDFTLPDDHPGVKSGADKTKKTQLHIGCAKWGRKDWVGTIYPPKTKEDDFLSHYAKCFNSVELNATFYKIPSRKQTEAWAAKVGDDFLFCPKVSQSITHIRRLKNANEATDRFLQGVSGFGKKLGPLFLMLHPGMAPKTLENLDEFLAYIPDDFNVFVEVRHPDWFTTETLDALGEVLHKRGAGFIITDAAGRRDCVHMRMTNNQTFIRFVGNGLHPSDYTRIDAWVKRIKTWMDIGIEKIFFFMHQHEEVHSPVLSKYLIEKINAECNLSIKVPEFQTDIV
ncbi:MAG TPA: DUF72 domain-containing protein [Ohtaekwangia sp.]|nr:DUF72 domain-containing protein [Ohtaekwangia sp.]